MEPIVAQQNFKKSLILVGGVSLLVGLILGVVAGFYYIKNSREAANSLISGKPAVNSQLSKEFVNNITELVPGKTYIGKVVKKDNSGIVLDVWVYNFINPALNQAVPVAIPFNSVVDKVLRPTIVKGAATSTSASFDDINMGDYLSVSILSDYKEFIITSAKAK